MFDVDCIAVQRLFDIGLALNWDVDTLSFFCDHAGLADHLEDVVNYLLALELVHGAWEGEVPDLLVYVFLWFQLYVLLLSHALLDGGRFLLLFLAEKQRKNLFKSNFYFLPQIAVETGPNDSDDPTGADNRKEGEDVDDRHL